MLAERPRIYPTRREPAQDQRFTSIPRTCPLSASTAARCQATNGSLNHDSICSTRLRPVQPYGSLPFSARDLAQALSGAGGVLVEHLWCYSFYRRSLHRLGRMATPPPKDLI